MQYNAEHVYCMVLETILLLNIFLYKSNQAECILILKENLKILNHEKCLS